MRKYGLVSVYTKRKFRAQKSSVNNANTENVLDRQFKDKRELEVLVSDLTYVEVLGHWNYVCLVLDLFNREIVGHAVGEHKSAELVQEALAAILMIVPRFRCFIPTEERSLITQRSKNFCLPSIYNAP